MGDNSTNRVRRPLKVVIHGDENLGVDIRFSTPIQSPLHGLDSKGW